MTIRSAMIRTATLALSIAAPAIGHADSPSTRSDKAMHTCIAAFVAATLPKEQPVRVRKEVFAASPVVPRSRGYEIVLTATGATSGKRLAKGTCTIDHTGAVVALNGQPLPADLAQSEIPTVEKTAAR